MPGIGELCGGWVTCDYTVDPSSCDVPDYSSNLVTLYCSETSDEWVDGSNGGGGANTAPPRCPCKRPPIGAQCSLPDAAPCEYVAGDPCEAVICKTAQDTNQTSAWDLPASCADHVSCPTNEPAEGALCTGKGGCWLGNPKTFWVCATTGWTKTKVTAY